MENAIPDEKKVEDALKWLENTPIVPDLTVDEVEDILEDVVGEEKVESMFAPVANQIFKPEKPLPRIDNKSRGQNSLNGYPDEEHSPIALLSFWFNAIRFFLLCVFAGVIRSFQRSVKQYKKLL
jgi:hypothetical protein